MAEDASDVGFEEGLSWLPAQILHEACGHFNQEQLDRRARHYQHHHHHHHHHHVNAPQSHPFPLHSRSGRKYHNKGRYGSNNRASSGGPGMQAIFLDNSAQKSCGTGVFLPRNADTDFLPLKKPACSPVLLPSRVVQALNLNVQVLSLQISPRQDKKANRSDKSVYSKEGKDKSEVISKDRSSSPEIFLPKEWSY